MPADRPPAFVPRSRIRWSAYRGLLTLAHALYRAGNGALFAAAGLLRHDELQGAAVAQCRAFNVAAADVDAGLSPAEADFYARFLGPGDRVLLAGSGTGRDLIALCLRGHEVTGLEPDPVVVAIAEAHLERRGVHAPILTGLIQTTELGGPYDAVIFSNGCYSLIPGAASRIAVLTRVAEHLAPRGRIIASYYPARPQSNIGRALTAITARAAGADWRPEPGDIFTRDADTPALVRYYHAFTPSEFAGECRSAGLVVVADELYGEGHAFAAAERRST